MHTTDRVRRERYGTAIISNSLNIVKYHQEENMDKKELQLAAVKVRKGIVTAVHAAKAGHPGGSLSAADIFTYLYFKEMNIDPKDPRKADRDRFVLSKGHTAPGLYSAMANRGYFPVEELETLRKLGSRL
jgi:transketolase